MARSSVRYPAIDTMADIRRGVKALTACCPLMARAYSTAGEPPLRRSPDGFAGLARIVVGQQLSTASASAIWARLEAVVDPFTPEVCAATGEEELRALGLSRPKVKTLRALGDSFLDGTLERARLAAMDDGEVHRALVAVHGLGPWTADVYLLFCLGRRDAFAPGDLALQVAAGDLTTAGARLSPRELEHCAEAWRPWRGVAARLLWAYYREMRNARDAIPV